MNPSDNQQPPPITPNLTSLFHVEHEHTKLSDFQSDNTKTSDYQNENLVVKRKAGRPKGSKDSKPRLSKELLLRMDMAPAPKPKTTTKNVLDKTEPHEDHVPKMHGLTIELIRDTLKRAINAARITGSYDSALVSALKQAKDLLEDDKAETNPVEIIEYAAKCAGESIDPDARKPGHCAWYIERMAQAVNARGLDMVKDWIEHYLPGTLATPILATLSAWNYPTFDALSKDDSDKATTCTDTPSDSTQSPPDTPADTPTPTPTDGANPTAPALPAPTPP